MKHGTSQDERKRLAAVVNDLGDADLLAAPIATRWKLNARPGRRPCVLISDELSFEQALDAVAEALRDPSMREVE